VERPSKGTLNGRRDKGNGLREMVSALWLSKGSLDAAAQQAAASRRERFRSCSLLWFIVFVGGTRGTGGGRACSGLVLCGSAHPSQRGVRDALDGFSL